MNQELQALLRAYREFHEAPADRAEELGFIYQGLLLEQSKRAGFAPEIIERALKDQRVVRAEGNRSSTLPPKAMKARVDGARERT